MIAEIFRFVNSQCSWHVRGSVL